MGGDEVEDGALTNSLSDLIKETPESALVPSEDTVRKWLFAT